jgi:hypothetical protein
MDPNMNPPLQLLTALAAGAPPIALPGNPIRQARYSTPQLPVATARQWHGTGEILQHRSL